MSISLLGGYRPDLLDKDHGRIVHALVVMLVFSWKLGLTVVACFVATFTVIMKLHGIRNNRPRGFYFKEAVILGVI